MQDFAKPLLDELTERYNTLDFIENDPISIPHQFFKKEDREISGFIAASLSWGSRKAIIKSANQLVTWMDSSPHEFILNATTTDLKPFEKFVYRTFNGQDCLYFLQALQHIYHEHQGLEYVFTNGFNKDKTIKTAISYFRETFVSVPGPERSLKHLANPQNGSAAKRINMFLRWMVRHDKNGVDFGIWKTIPASQLMIPLDVHSGRVAREFNLLQRKQSDWKAVEELTTNLRKLDPTDPVKYDFALFGAGVNNQY